MPMCDNIEKEFSELGLSKQIVRNLLSKGYKNPTPIQTKTIPVILENRDLIAISQTGTGKTAGFTLPIIEKLKKKSGAKGNHIRSLILVPTRELARQVEESILKYSINIPLSCFAIYGGVKINPQMMKLRRGFDILIATPGRLLDLYRKNAVRFSQLEILVLDEADRMLNLGFNQELNEILDLLPVKRQNILFSATFADEVEKLAAKVVNNPLKVEVEPEVKTAITIDHWLHPVDKNRKSALLIKLIKEGKWDRVLVFVKTQHTAKRLEKFLDKKNITNTSIHGGKSQSARNTALTKFKNGDITVLVATDIAARGIDISSITHVINYDLPHVPENYIHRIGRTGRAEKNGTAISLVSVEEFEDLVKIERQIQSFIKRNILKDFEPKEELPQSPEIKPLKPKKPKKKKKKLPE